MYGSQIERLKRDSRELDHFIKRLEKEGDETKVFKLLKKQQFLNGRINDIEEALHQYQT